MARRITGSIRLKRPVVFKVTVDMSKAKKLTHGDWTQPVTRQSRSETVEGSSEDAEHRLCHMVYEADTGIMPTGRVMLNAWLGY